MIKLYKCHFQYLLTKFLAIIIIILVTILILFSLSVVKSLDFKESNKELTMTFFDSTIQISKLIAITFGVVLFSYNFTNTNDQYRALILVRGISRIRFVISKIIVLFSVVFIIYLCEIIIMIFIALNYNLFLTPNMLICISDIILVISYFCLITLIFIQLTDNFYSLFLSLGCLFLSNLNNKAISYIIITIDEDNELMCNRIYYILLLIFLLLINIIMYRNRDLHN